MRSQSLTFIVLLLHAVTAPATDQPSLHASADDVKARVTAIPGGHRLVRVPETEFELAINARCDKDMQVDAVSVSIADTHQRVTTEPAGSDARIETRLLVKASQIAPIAVDGFCDSGEQRNRQLDRELINNVLRAQISVRCKSEQAVRMRYSSVALNIELQCDRGDCGENADCDEEDQASSSSMTRF
ncbi:MAG: hypothetical protein KJO82_02970 [Gammaproteobacteria bacterium]|nr:hypothetical protein [Gammaproteobacteria bacterium]